MSFLNRLLGCLLLPVTGFAQIQLNSRQELIQYADEHGAVARQAKIQPLSARQDVTMQASGLFPKINAFAIGDYYPIIPVQVLPAEVLGGTPGTYLRVQFGLPYIFQAGAELSMPVVNLEKWAQLSKARAQYSQVQWSSKAALENYHIQLIQAYYQSLVTREVLNLNSENLETADELMRIVDARNKAGVLNPADYNRAHNLQLDIRSTGINYQKALAQSMNSLNYMLTTGDSIVLTEDISSFNWPVLHDVNDINNRAAWSEVNSKVRVAELALSESQKGGLPRLSLNGRYARNLQSRFDGSDNVQFDVGDLAMRLDVPLFQGNYYRSLQKKNKFQLEMAKYEQQNTQAMLTRQQNDWFAQYIAAYDRQHVLKQKLAGASDNLRIAKLSMEEGVMEFDELNNIFIEYNRARMDYIQNLADGILYYLLSTQNF